MNYLYCGSENTSEKSTNAVELFIQFLVFSAVNKVHNQAFFICLVIFKSWCAKSQCYFRFTIQL